MLRADDAAWPRRTLFEVIDSDDSGELDYGELAHGLHKLQFSPPINLTHEEFMQFTGTALCNFGECGMLIAFCMPPA